ncbi:Putative heterokaryon incompatibility [Colletotrichum destructivum]|uniref:Heterokaryon incompatibility n=1 Tax=Colletotrichum destructivum TaxID=34406 RepID=A0AAX4I5V0_9PEZI|nr:Putative heterokaryon incompatibility [Colletotrichum destructivum]
MTMTKSRHRQRPPLVHDRCPFCRNLTPGAPDEDGDGLHATLSIVDLRSDWLFKANVWIDHCRTNHSCDGGLSAKAKTIVVETSAEENAEGIGEGPSTSSSTRTSKIRSLPNVDDSPCPGDRPPPRLPRKVLDLRLFSSKGKLRLLEPEGMCGVYVCLSYTCDRQNTCVTTPDSLQSNLDNIPYDQLPQTYKDAVTVALALNFPFLWIDGLCIIQGDKDSVDWKEQSSQMADVYENAVLVIATASCTSVEDGVLSTARPSRDLTKFEGHHHTQPRLEVHARPMLNHSRLGWSNLAKPKAEGTLSRSWCFQEEILAARLLTFYGGEMNFQCLEEEYRFDPYETPNWMWQSAVEHYTRRRLTAATDRLVAISSMARVAQLALRTRYVAGHWWDADFLCSLCWAPVRTEETERTFSADCYVAPSWSWAAHNGPVTMWIPYAGSEEPVTPRADDVGAVSSGNIAVRGVFLGLAVDTKPRE